ncbi:hypothetical protein EB796_009847 [Bugula neritina]|nr:hypothetical protein EB796_009847 [Bugula neritina]
MTSPDGPEKIVTPEETLPTTSGLIVKLKSQPEALTVVIRFSPTDSSKPIKVQLDVFACLKPIESTTSKLSTTSMRVPTETTTSLKATPSTASPATTTAITCEIIDAMKDPQYLPTYRIDTSPSDSEKENLRPTEVLPWVSKVPVVGNEKPFVTVTLTDDGSLAPVDRLEFPVLENVDEVTVSIMTSPDGPEKIVTPEETLPTTSGLIVKLKSQPEALTVVIRFSPTDSSKPIKVQLDVFACLKPIESTTSKLSTTSMRVPTETTTSLKATPSTASPATTTAITCEIIDAMKDPQYLPTYRIDTSPSDSEKEN